MNSNIEPKEINEHTVIIEIEGYIDTDLAKSLKPIVANYVKNKKLLIINMKKVDFMSSAGLGVFLFAAKDISEKQGQIWITDAKPQVEKVFKLTRVDKMFTFYQTLEDAKNYIP